MPNLYNITSAIKAALIVYLLLVALPIQAQYCEWLKTSGSIGNDFVSDIATDKDNNSIVVGSFLDTFIFAGDTILPNSTLTGSKSFIIKYDTDGKELWIASPVMTGGQRRLSLYDVAVDSNNNIFVVGDLDGAADFGNGITTIGGNYPILIKYDSSGVAQWVHRANITSSVATSAKVHIDNDNDVYWCFDFKNNLTFTGSTQTFTSNGVYNLALLKYRNNGTYVRGGVITSPKNNAVSDLGSDSYKNLYLIGYSDTTFTYGSQTLAGKGEIILKMDSVFTPLKARKTNLNTNTYTHTTMAVKGNGRFAVASTFYDTVDFGGVQLISPYTQMLTYYRTVRLVYYDENLNAVWGRMVEKANSSQDIYLTVNGKMYIKNENIYFGGFMAYNSAKFGSSVLNSSGIKGRFYLAKVDTLGNVLWAFNDPDTAYSSNFAGVSVNEDGDVMLAGGFTGKISIFNQSDSVPFSTKRSEIFTTKISDFYISRGYVSSGPYCAGDSILIPYTLKGYYKNGNQFIAQLSDSAGNFDSTYYELGRINSTTNDTIKGTLPLFNVATNNRYRIRILSTKPTVQSFYKLDTLRLLIFSKDTANAGPDITLCRGQSILLGTTGGSRWRWWPPTFMPNPADTSNRQPLVKPDSTTQYRIIISDSSGCGEIDTDFVVIHVRPDIKTTILGDSIVCKGFKQTLTAKPTGGDSTHYWYIWKNAAFGITLGKTPQLTVRPVSTTKYMLLVGDSCSSRVDTTYFTIKPENNLSVSATPDTSICIGRNVKLGAMGVGCNPNKYTYNWYAGSTHLANTDSVTVSPTATTTYSIILKDTSTLLVDTAWVTVTPLAPLALSLNADTTICKGQNTLLSTTPTGGYIKNHHLQWYANNQPLSTQLQLPVSPTATTIYKAILTDGGCSLANDSAEVTITVRPPLSLTLSADTTICIGQNATLSATPAGGWPAGYSIQWLANGIPVDTNYTLTISPAITTTYTAILNDGCTTLGDSGTIQITVRPALAITTTADTTICVAQNVLLRATPTGGLPAGYSIQWWANNTLADTTPTITVSPNQTTTYKAVLKDGCTTKGDSSQTQITVRPPLAVTATAKDSICANQILLLTATATGGHAANHNLQWYTASANWSATTNPATDTPKVNTQYIVRLADNCSPDVFDTLNITVLPIPKANAGIAPTFGCPPLNVTLQDFSTGNDTLLNSWNIGTVEYKGNANLSHLLTTPGTYPVRLAVANTLGCSDVWVLNGGITVFPKPKADFIIKPDIKEVEEPLHLLNYSKNANNVIWNMGNGTTLYPQGTGDTTYTYTDTGWMNIALIAQNHLGCYDTALGRILVYDKIHCSIPSAFTPNGDEHNNTFAPVCVGVATYTLTIYNRWGQVIFTQENGIWDGTYYGTPVPAGVYMYKLHIQADSHKKRLTYGTIQVIK